MVQVAGRPLEEVARQIKKALKVPPIDYNLLHESDRWALKLGYRPSEWDAMDAKDKARLITTQIIEDEIELCVNSFEKFTPAVGKPVIDAEAEIDRLWGDE